jgi:hypothetical protein
MWLLNLMTKLWFDFYSIKKLHAKGGKARPVCAKFA